MLELRRRWLPECDRYELLMPTRTSAFRPGQATFPSILPWMEVC
jgi:hypothetical protein